MEHTDTATSQPNDLPARAVSAESEKTRRYWNKFAPRYDRSMQRMERFLLAGGRQWACSQATGRVLEIAVGTGRNLPYYPAGVNITGIEFSPAMLERARALAYEVRPDADLRLGDAQALDFPDGGFDTVVCTLSLCSIPDDAAAVSEMKRVLRPGGKLILMEHVGSSLRVVRLIQRFLEIFTKRLIHDNLTREPLDHLRREGFIVDEVQRSKLGVVERTVAHKPD